MKKFLAFLFVVCCWLNASAGKNTVVRTASKRLALVLKDNQKREDITPDSFFYDWRHLKAEMLAQKDSTAKAIYRAAMAHLLCQNQWRSQRFSSKTQSHPDSIQEWSRQEYQTHAVTLYAQAMQDLEALHKCKLSDTKPLTELGRDDGIFSGDLLYLIWQAFRQDCPSATGRVPGFADIIELYRRHGLREATLLLTLDSLQEAPLQTSPRGGRLSDAQLPSSSGEGLREGALLRLRDEYADLPSCAQVYLLLASLQDKTNQEQYALLQEALQRYPKSREANELRNRISELRRPQLSGRFRLVCYPDHDYDISFQVKNMQSGSMTVYRVPTDFEFSDDEKAGTKLEQVHRRGTLVETLSIPMEGVDALETKHDTLRWHSPSFGRYALVLDGTTKEKLERKPEPQIVLTTVSALTFMSTTLPDGKKRIMVTDAISGEPQQGVKAVFYKKKQQAYSLIRETMTDGRGIAEIAVDKRDVIYVELSRAEDKAFGRQSLGWSSFPELKDKRIRRLNVYTDRSIYRPGQMVYVGGIAYAYSHDQSPKPVVGEEYKLVLSDVNGQKVIEHTLKTDEFGTLKDSLQLPESGLPGSYHIRIGDNYHYFRVEEYRRPTFQVEFDEVPAISLPADSITLTGRAMTYSQWPVANARVTGSYGWQQSWWWKRYRSSTTHDIDTLYTDEEGRFSIRVPVSKELSEEDLRWGQTLRLSVEVLSPEGETQQGSCRVPLCSTPLRMKGDVPEQENRESLKPWRFDLYASNDKPVQGEVLCSLLQNGQEVKSFLVPANRDTIPDVLHTLPSGQYDLYAKSSIYNPQSSIPNPQSSILNPQSSILNPQSSINDTASFRASFTIFSITDKRLIGKHDLWLYTPCDTISAERPARFQIGTTLPDAWIYFIINGEKGLVRDTLLHLSDEAMLMEVPYEERFQHHLAVTMMLVHEGQFRQERLDFKLEQPDKRLSMHWDTFRDHLQPGQKETWKLTLTRPDGKPASANVMVGMYDSSLDALASYSMTPNIYHACDRSIFPPIPYFERFNRYSSAALDMSLHILPYRDYDFARWNDQLFGDARRTRSTKTTMRLRGLGANRVEEVYATMAVPAREYAGAVMNFKEEDLDGLSFESVEQALQGQIAGLDVAAKEFSGEVMTEEAKVEEAYVRSNLSELAFFYPQLRTDSKGQTSIEFTLPEGLTSWHLHGLAHTKDMMTAQWQETIVAKKELMAELTLPRFLRNGDEVSLTASIRNASDKRQKGEAVLVVYNVEQGARSKGQEKGQWSMVNGQWCKSLKQMKFTFDLQPGKEVVYHMPVKATVNHPVLAVQWIAKAKGSSDGEVRYLPVLSDMQNVTETRTYLLRGDTTLTMKLDDLFAKGNPKAVGKSLTIEHVAEPIYLALQALPSLTAPVRNDVLSVASAYYGGSVAYHIAHKYPKVRKALESFSEKEMVNGQWSMVNEKLADILLNETPWMLEAEQQKVSRQRLASLFAEIEQEQRRMTMLAALSARQHEDGSFGWFPGMSGSVWMTSEVATLLVRLGAIKGVLSVPERQILDKAMSFLQKEMHKEVENLRKEKRPTLSLSELRYLYIYIMYRNTLSNSPLKGENSDESFLLSLLKKQAEELDREPRALAAIVLQKAGEEKVAKALMPRVHELLNHKDGAYLAYPGGSFTSIDRKVETHVNLMEAVQTVEPKETDLYARMTEWLILQKRTQEWERPVQSADAIYALTAPSPDPSPEEEGSQGSWRGVVTYDNQTRKLQAQQPFSAYVRERIEPINKAKTLTIEQHNGEASLLGGRFGGGLSWGAVFAQYQLPASEAEAHREGLTIRRELPSPLGKGLGKGTVHIRYTITADRDYEYVCLRAPRPAAAEPAQQLSGYHWQNGIGYYQAMHDASTEYFMDRLPRGTYVIEEDWLISRTGDFLLPPARLTCLYAPEFQSQTAGEKFQVK